MKTVLEDVYVAQDVIDAQQMYFTLRQLCFKRNATYAEIDHVLKLDGLKVQLVKCYHIVGVSTIVHDQLVTIVESYIQGYKDASK